MTGADEYIENRRRRAGVLLDYGEGKEYVALPAAGESVSPARHIEGGQCAKVPEWVAYKGLDATALNVRIILAAKAGRDRVAWISHRTIGEELGVHRTTVGRAVRKLTKVGVIEDAGKVVVNLRYQSLFQMLNLKLRKTRTPTAKPKAHRRGG
jgi:hypothetical protein